MADKRSRGEESSWFNLFKRHKSDPVDTTPPASELFLKPSIPNTTTTTTPSQPNQSCWSLKSHLNSLSLKRQSKLNSSSFQSLTKQRYDASLALARDTWKQAKEGGFGGTQKDYFDLIRYRERVMRGIETDRWSVVSTSTTMTASRPSSVLSSRTTATAAADSISIPLKPPAPVKFTQEQTWIRLLREKLRETHQQWQQESKNISVSAPPPTRDNFPELTKEISLKIKQALTKPIVIEKYNIPIKHADISTLLNRNWLNDEVINFYGSMIMERDNSLHYFNTFFYPKLLQGYANVRRWTKKFNLFEKRLILIPIHLGNHWCLCVVDFENKDISYYDSLHTSNHKCINAIKDYLMQESRDKNIAFSLDGWTFRQRKDIPAQENGYDCGVFACIFAEYASRREEFDFTQRHMEYFRKRMIYEISEGRLMLS